MVKCSFCENAMPPGTGKILIKKDAKIIYFCSRKCEKNMLVLKRNPRKLKWTKYYVKGGR